MFSISREIWHAFLRPWKAPSFILYFVFMVIGFGGIGVFLSIFQYFSFNERHRECAQIICQITRTAIAQNMMTYSIAILVPAALSLFLHLIIPKAKHKVSHSILTITILICVILVVCFTFLNGNIWVACGAVVISWIFWVISNSENESIKDDSYNTMIQNEVKKHGKDWN